MLFVVNNKLNSQHFRGKIRQPTPSPRPSKTPPKDYSEMGQLEWPISEESCHILLASVVLSLAIHILWRYRNPFALGVLLLGGFGKDKNKPSKKSDNVIYASSQEPTGLDYFNLRGDTSLLPNLPEMIPFRHLERSRIRREVRIEHGLWAQTKLRRRQAEQNVDQGKDKTCFQLIRFLI